MVKRLAAIEPDVSLWSWWRQNRAQSRVNIGLRVLGGTQTGLLMNDNVAPRVLNVLPGHCLLTRVPINLSTYVIIQYVRF